MVAPEKGAVWSINHKEQRTKRVGSVCVSDIMRWFREWRNNSVYYNYIVGPTYTGICLRVCSYRLRCLTDSEIAFRRQLTIVGLWRTRFARARICQSVLWCHLPNRRVAALRARRTQCCHLWSAIQRTTSSITYHWRTLKNTLRSREHLPTSVVVPCTE